MIFVFLWLTSLCMTVYKAACRCPHVPLILGVLTQSSLVTGQQNECIHSLIADLCSVELNTPASIRRMRGAWEIFFNKRIKGTAEIEAWLLPIFCSVLWREGEETWEPAFAWAGPSHSRVCQSTVFLMRHSRAEGRDHETGPPGTQQGASEMLEGGRGGIKWPLRPTFPLSVHVSSSMLTSSSYHNLRKTIWTQNSDS